jgi:hypothetical protein
MAMACVAKENFLNETCRIKFISVINAATKSEGISIASKAFPQ